MQLRKCCNHPYLFDGVEQESDEEFGDHIVTSSGKMMFVDKLLAKCKKSKEQVLIFSGFTSMLDILEDLMTMRKIKFCRLDGSTPL